MKVFVDECVDWRLARDIVGHEVKTASQMGWLTIKNGELLALTKTLNRLSPFVATPDYLIATSILRASALMNADAFATTALPTMPPAPMRLSSTSSWPRDALYSGISILMMFFPDSDLG